MDKRIAKTQAAIKTALITLLKKKPLHKITIKELCEEANINKSTFYTYYTDIYHLMESFRQEVIAMVVSSIPHDREYSLDNPSDFTREITIAFHKHNELLCSLFSQKDITAFGLYLEEALKKTIFSKLPHLESDERLNILLSYCIQGAFYAQMNNPNVSFDILLETLDTIVKTLQPLYHNSEK